MMKKESCWHRGLSVHRIGISFRVAVKKTGELMRFEIDAITDNR
jgi:hypothetical protein